MLGLSNDIKIKVNSDKDCIHALSVELPVSKVQEKVEQAFKEVQARVKLPGFRPGKAPLEVVRESYKEAAFERAQEALLQEGVSEALKAKKIQAVATPVVESIQFSPEKPFHFDFKVEVAPVFKAANYKGLKLNKKVKVITDEDVQKSIQNLANWHAKLVESKSDVLGETQFAVIDYEGFIDGKSIPGAKSENFLMDMSAPQTISGLAEGLKGAKAGEDREIKVNFPADSPSKDLAGREAIFKVKLQAIKEKISPAIDDELAKDLGVESLVVLQSKIRESLEKEGQREIQADLEKQVIAGLMVANQFSVPPSLVAHQVEHLTKQYQERLLKQGVGEENLKTFMENSKADVQKEGEKEVRLAYLLNAIAEAEGIKVSEEQITSRINLILDRSEPKDRSAMEKTLRGDYLDRITSEVKESNVFKWLIDHAKIKEVSGGA